MLAAAVLLVTCAQPPIETERAPAAEAPGRSALPTSSATALETEWARVTEGRLAERTMPLVPIAGTHLLPMTGAGMRIGLNLDAPEAPRTAVIFGAELQLTDRLSVGIEAPTLTTDVRPRGGAPTGNVGFSGRFVALDRPAYQWGLVAELRLPTASALARETMVFGEDIPRFGPRTTTVRLGAGVVGRFGPAVVGGLLGGDVSRRDDLVEDAVWLGAAWGTASAGLPLFGRIGDRWGLALGPLVELTGRTTISSAGGAQELVFTAGASLGGWTKRYAAEGEIMRRLALHIGYQQPIADGGVASLDVGGRLVVGLTFGRRHASAAFAPLGGDS